MRALNVVLAIGVMACVARAEDVKPSETTPKAEGQGSDMVKIQTSLGDITVELDAAKAPETVKNFLQYVDDKHYDGTIFHRVIANFMIQGGGFTADMNQKPTRAPIRNEAGNGLKNQRGAIAMARTSIPDSATSQFFINTVDNGFLNREESPDKVGYCVFGKVTEGMDVVDKIRAVATGRKSGMSDVPVDPVTITSISRIKQP